MSTLEVFVRLLIATGIGCWLGAVLVMAVTIIRSWRPHH